MLQIANKTKNKDFFFLRLITVPNPEGAVANDARLSFSLAGQDNEEDNEEDVVQILADIEITNLIQFS